MNLTEDDFPDFQSNNYQELVEEFFEMDRQASEDFDKFCWEKFERHRQNYEDYIADGQIEDKLLEKYE